MSKRKKTKKNITVSIEPKLYNLLDDKIDNKSKYIEWLIYQDLLKVYVNNEMKIILI